MFGRKKERSESKAESKMIKSTDTQSSSACGGKCQSAKSESGTKSSDMTSGSRSTKSCGGKCTSTKSKSSAKASSSKSTSAKAKTTKSCS